MAQRNIGNICPRCRLAQRLPMGWCQGCLNDYRQTQEAKVARKGYNQKYRRNNPDYNLRYKYDLSAEERNLMLMEQEFKCAACEQSLNLSNPREVHIDHCHIGGLVRGILCSGCNQSLGLMKEDPERIRKLAEYAQKIQNDKVRPARILFPISLSLEERDWEG